MCDHPVIAANPGEKCSVNNHTPVAMVCFIAMSSLTFVSAFCPSELRPQTIQFATKASNARTRRCGPMHSRHIRVPTTLFSNDDEVNDAINRIVNEDASDSTQESDDGDGDDDEDVIIQKLSRNAQRGPINPMKEHDKMMQENQAEAQNITSSGNDSTNNDESVVDSTFYKSLLASYIDPYIDIYDTHDTHYVDEQFFEMLSREGKELEMLGPGVATTPLDPTSDEAKAEAELARKEEDVQKIAKQISSTTEGNWDREKIEEAQRLTAEIDRMHIDDCGAVLLANLAFYEAFSARDADWMSDVWWGSPSVTCIHPSHAPLIGNKAVQASFKNMFTKDMLGRESRGAGTKTAPNVFMSPANIRALSVRGTTASLVCDEEIFNKGPGYSGRFVVNKLLTTNVFRKIGGKWKLVHRHASWHPSTLAAQAGSKAKPGFVPVKTERELYNEELEDKRMRIKKLQGRGTSIRPPEVQRTPTSLDGLNTNNIVGIPEEKVKSKQEKKSSSDDLLRMLGLSSGSSDDDNDEDDGEESSKPKSKGLSLSDLLSKGTSTTSGSGTPEDPFITRRVISIGPEQFNQLAAEGTADEDANDLDGDDVDDDEDEESVVIDLREKSEEERKSILSRIFPDQVDELMKTIGERDKDKGKPGELKSAAAAEILPVPFKPAPFIKPMENKEKKQSAKQKCIDTIRVLSDQGQLSSKQKRVLLTDIIACSAKGETSMVEVAYDLLLTENSEPGMEDFTEQCRVFAAACDQSEFNME